MRNSSHVRTAVQQNAAPYLALNSGRHYWWRTARCSKKCVDRFNARRQADHRWLRVARGLAHATEGHTEFEATCMENHA